MFERFQEWRFVSPEMPHVAGYSQEFWRMSGYQVLPGPPAGGFRAQIEHEGFRRVADMSFLPSPQGTVAHLVYRAEPTAAARKGSRLRGAFSNAAGGLGWAARSTMGSLLEETGSTGGSFAGQAVYSTQMPTPGYVPQDPDTSGLDNEWNSLVLSYQDFLTRQRGARLWAPESAAAWTAQMAGGSGPPPTSPTPATPTAPPSAYGPPSPPPVPTAGPPLAASVPASASVRCGKCSTELPPGSRFCNVCGNPMS
jgi:hypothetical protein